MQERPRDAVWSRHRRDGGISSGHCSRGVRGRTVGLHRPEEWGPFRGLRVALVHDFLYVYAGAERVLEQLITLFPSCDLFALFDHLPDNDRHFLRGKEVTTSLLQNLPFVRRHHRAYLPLMPLAIEQLDVSDYDLVISSSHLVAKGILTGPDQLHVCYCHTPARYAWDLQHEYLDRAGLGYGPRGLLVRRFLHKFRIWDATRVNGIRFIANSHFVARRIENCYDRHATVVHAPVDIDFYHPARVPREDYYLVAGRMVPYKRTDLIVGAFARRPDLKLKVIGTGPEYDRVRRRAGPNVELLGFQDDVTLRDHYHRAKALVFAAEEDFGIVPVEAMACGTPVIAYGRGGVTETVTPGLHGVMFDRQTENSLLEAVDRFESMGRERQTDSANIRRNAERFSRQRFRDEMSASIAAWVADKWPTRAIGIARPPVLTGNLPSVAAATSPLSRRYVNGAKPNVRHRSTKGREGPAL